MQIATQYLSETEEGLQKAATLLQNGKTVIFPTETVYGLGANALDEKAVEGIFLAKGRPSDNPLIVHIAERAVLTDLVAEVPASAEILMDRFWPGPLTLIFRKTEKVPKAVTGGLDTVAIRMPEHKTAHRLLELAQIPVAAPSANRSGFPSPTVFSHVKSDMDGRVDAIIMGGDCEVGVESTVLDLSGKTPILYRPGAVTLEEIEDCIGKVTVVTAAKEGETPKSPGLKYRHYAPKAEVEILRGDLDQIKAYAKTCCDNGKTGILTFDEFPLFDARLLPCSLGSKNDAKAAAHRLFGALRELDEAGAERILAPEIPENGVWRAVRNRLYRAAGERVVDLTSQKQILFVCTGNTCRSPMAEGLLKDYIKKEGKPITVSSAGLFASGAPASKEAVSAMQEVCIDIAGHRSRQVSEEILKNADLVLTMTEAHCEMLCAAFPSLCEKIKTLAEWAGEKQDVADPYGGSLAEYRACREQIADLLKKGCKNL